MADLTLRRKMERSKVYEAIDSERKFQDRKWGTIEQHPHEVGGWLTLMRTLLSDAEKAWSTNNNDGPALDELRKVLAVGVACCEQHGVEHRWLHTDIEGKGGAVSSTDHLEYLPHKGWLSRQLAAAENDIAEWPEWMRKESGRMEKNELTLAEMRERISNA